MDNCQLLKRKLFLEEKINNRDFTYRVIYSNNFKKKDNILICHIADFEKDINYFVRVFDDKAFSNYDIYLTTNKIETDPKYVGVNNITILLVDNVGYDIGPFLSVLHYLYKSNKNYKLLMKIHSKSNIARRDQYIKPFINFPSLISTHKFFEENNIAAIFPNTIHIYNEKTPNLWKNNFTYLKELSIYLGLENQTFDFPEGNVYVVLFDMINKYFPQDKIEFLYKMLNNQLSIDPNWFEIIHGIKVDETNYELYLNNGYQGNDLKRRRLPDGMIEHSFERLMINMVKNYGKNYIVLGM